ncbi:NAD-dependent epimerase/dehydratase family protein [Demequina mangrovi]|uniref:Nucleoside-diphosphate-sugar epimerase n=1 Tax=Demequina mangrovi TaxID=1043493 RepID=A0A1H6W939_9MICO|nr:NAD(P)-dependent oxidoreductase [Demequina mangrovi]SEJ10567.1 Nucleoside-diphosphate-sugar epimerase [Demequina mangrovi]
MSTTVLVTGATGWLGGHILAALRDAPGVTTVAAARDGSRLPSWFTGPTRLGDLADPAYRRAVVRDVDAVIHAGTWSSLWGHPEAERTLYLAPALDLMDRAVEAGVSRFVGISTVAIGEPAGSDRRVSDDDAPVPRAYWPHLTAMVEVERRMAELGTAQPRTSFVALRAGHFVGPGLAAGLVPALIPRLKTGMVPWVDGGRAHLPLTAGEDLGRAFALAATAEDLEGFTPIIAIGGEQPTAREVFSFIAAHAGTPRPRFSAPRNAAFRFAGLAERLERLSPGPAPFLTRPLVHVGLDWHVESTRARELLGYEPQVDWRDAARAGIEERRALGFPWPRLAQPAPGQVVAGAGTGAAPVPSAKASSAA